MILSNRSPLFLRCDLAGIVRPVCACWTTLRVRQIGRVAAAMWLLHIGAWGGLAATPRPVLPVNFVQEIQPILESTCVRCHNAETTEGGLNLVSRELAIQGGQSGPALVPGEPKQSLLLSSALLPSDQEHAMPPEGPALAKSQTDRLEAWITEGAPWPDDVRLGVQVRIDFGKHIQPILEQECLACHSSAKAEGDLNLTSRETAFTTGHKSPSIRAGYPDRSPLYKSTTLAKDDKQLMPPIGKGGPLAQEAIEKLRLWIAQGAIWPDGVSLQAKPKASSAPATPDTIELVAQIHALITQTSKQQSASEMENYEGTIPKTGAKYQMVAIAGGTFQMGSRNEEPHRKPDEGPPMDVTIDPFWMGKYEVTWDEYEPYMINKEDRAKHGTRKDFDPSKHTMLDALSQPTAPYTEMSFGMGQKDYPAISMTQHAANKYCQWLSAQTGHFYRLATEAEWEYACRAGTTTAYSWGDDPAKIGEYAWYYENSNEKYQKPGKKKPNPWGLYDMHGNVMEWVADRYEPDYFERIQNATHNPYLLPEKIDPRSVRGGGWDDDPEQLRSAARRGSDPEWKRQDPQLPKSIWYHTDAKWLGFRIVRPLTVPSVEEMYTYWNSATNKR
ncbi:MAG: SUMF1/EgtB/PvdO family nonheme iron enzyme [Planctomycetota bacterium]|nr:SUMF1/EgtB/PvdO family nonheme iron enzyme [Planctomycetota bacterium]MDA1178344.1 SUMF1/EgtB/PvdO family nonheme iron enzyme [Planctomycetota bacterium]